MRSNEFHPKTIKFCPLTFTQFGHDIRKPVKSVGHATRGYHKLLPQHANHASNSKSGQNCQKPPLKTHRMLKASLKYRNKIVSIELAGSNEAEAKIPIRVNHPRDIAKSCVLRLLSEPRLDRTFSR
jgi:hypothetical protein